MSFSFIQITDHHIRESETAYNRGYATAHALRTTLRHIAAHAGDVDFIVSTGDLANDGLDAEYGNFRRMLNLRLADAPPGPHSLTAEGLTDMPYYVLPGNHDPRPAFFANLFPQVQPAPLMNAAFHHKGVQFLCLDLGPKTKSEIFAATLDFLRGALAAGEPTIIFTHHHIVPTGARWLDAFIADDLPLLLDALRGQNVLAILSGHAHVTYEREIVGIPVLGLRSTCFQFAIQDDPLFILQPPHYRVVTVADGKVSWRIHEAPL